MRAECEARGLQYCEAPMTRTPIHADRGEVNILFGGDENLMEELRPTFAFYAENIFHVGPAGHAVRLKLIHNFIAFANVASFCEGFALAAREGLDMSKVIGIISAAGGTSGMMDLYGEKTLRGFHAPYVPVKRAKRPALLYRIAVGCRLAWFHGGFGSPNLRAGLDHGARRRRLHSRHQGL